MKKYTTMDKDIDPDIKTLTLWVMTVVILQRKNTIEVQMANFQLYILTAEAYMQITKLLKNTCTNSTNL